MLDAILNKINKIPEFKFYGKVCSISGLMIEVKGLEGMLSIGTKCSIISKSNKKILSEVVSLKDDKAVIMPFFDVSDISVGSFVELEDRSDFILPSEDWLGRVINALAKPIDDKGVMPEGEKPYFYRSTPIPAHKRKMVEGKIDLGVRAVNTYTTCCKGQRIGLFAGSGVGKSMLVAMLTKYSSAEVKVIGLIGERGRELQEFLQNYLGEEGIKNAVVIAATSDESALMRRQAAYLTMAVAEYFRDQGKEVLCLMDSVTRFALAQREIGLSAGEPPATRGYTPSVFTEMPKLLERAGPGLENETGSITGLFTVLVEGDDHNEPISDTVRGILDGHIVMERKIAERGRYPAINVLKSVSRMMPSCNNDMQNMLVQKSLEILSVYDDMAEMIRLGAYKQGSDTKVDEAIRLFPQLEEFLKQQPADNDGSLDVCYKKLAEILGVNNSEMQAS
jgi:flagellum-specific ATP synthase